MQIKKSIQLTTEPFEALVQSGQSIDFRLDQEAWKDLSEGDFIEFWEDLTGWQIEPEQDARKVVVKIKKIYRAPTFNDLFVLIEEDLSQLGDKEELLSGLRSWWSEEKEQQEGALAFYVVRAD